MQRLTVLSFAFAADTNAPSAGVPFHLIVTLHVRERVSRIDDLELPMLAQLELLGDERQLQSGPDGTRYRETIAVVAHQAGTLVIGPAVLQAIDPRDRRAKQYATNGLVLHVAGPAPSIQGVERETASLTVGALRIVLWAAGIVCVAVLVVVLLRRRPAPPAVAVETAAAPPQPAPRSARDELVDALAVLRAEASRASAVRVRALVWGLLGAEEGETLGDVLRRPAASSPPVAGVLRALERAAFTYETDLPAALSDARAALERLLEEMT